MMNREKIHEMIGKANPLELELVWIPKIMQNQTFDERDHEMTKYHNKIGLTGFDGNFVGSIYHQIQSNKHLSTKQVTSIKKILPKY